MLTADFCLVRGGSMRYSLLPTWPHVDWLTTPPPLTPSPEQLLDFERSLGLPPTLSNQIPLTPFRPSNLRYHAYIIRPQSCLSIDPVKRIRLLNVYKIPNLCNNNDVSSPAIWRSRSLNLNFISISKIPLFVTWEVCGRLVRWFYCLLIGGSIKLHSLRPDMMSLLTLDEKVLWSHCRFTGKL